MGVFWSKSPSAPPAASDPQREERHEAAEPIEREPSPSRLGDAIALDAAEGGDRTSWHADQQAVWVPDNSSSECMLCKRGFGWFTRKHRQKNNCRQCGSLVCSQCSPHRALARGFLTSQRVCTGCMGAMALAEQSALNSRRHSFSQQQQQKSQQQSRRSRRNSPSRLVADRHAEHKAEEAAKQIKISTDDDAVAAAAVITAPVAQHAQPQATVLTTHHQFTSSVSSSGLPPQHTPRSRPASPHDGSSSTTAAAAASHHASSLSVATTVASPSPRASIRRGSISPSHSQSHSPSSRRKSISGSFPMPSAEALAAGAAVVAVGAVAVAASSSSSAAPAPASDASSAPAPAPAAAAASVPFLADSLTPLVLFNRLAGFGSLLVLDLRSADEYKAGHVPRALNIPMTDGDLIGATAGAEAEATPTSVEGELQPAECTTMLAALEKRLHMTDQRAFRMRQRCTVVLVGSPFVPADAAADSASAASSADASPAPFSVTPHLSSSHHPHCLHLARLLQTEAKIAAVSVLVGGHSAFASAYPFTVCAYSAAESKSGKHIHKKPFPWYPCEIVPARIYLGSKVDAQNLDHLQHLRITHVLNCTTEIPNHFEDQLKDESADEPLFTYKRIELHDEVNVCISDHFSEAFRFLDAALASPQGRVLVHCQEGISRSSTNLIAYLMARHQLTLQAAYSWVKAQRKQIFPNLGFWRQLDLFERTLMHSSLLSAATAAGADASTVPSVEELKGTMDQCIDLALLTAEYQARVAAKAAAAAAAANEGEAAADSSASSSSASSSEPAEETASERVRCQVLSPVEKSNTLRAVRGVAGEDAKIRAEEAVVEEAATPQGPIVTSEG